MFYFPVITPCLSELKHFGEFREAVSAVTSTKKTFKVFRHKAECKCWSSVSKYALFSAQLCLNYSSLAPSLHMKAEIICISLEGLSKAVKFVSWLSASGNCNKNEVKPSIKNILEKNGHLPAAYWQSQREHDFSQEAKYGTDNNHRAEIFLFHICLKLD